jgi:spore germination cell wall hydrolase CwlJ-like protein
MPSARFRLRLFWYRLDKEAGIALLAFVLIACGLAFAVRAVVDERENAMLRLQAQHQQSIACLARNVYFEARGEPEIGQYAVAEVTMNRKASGIYPNTVCGGVYERSAFSWTAADLMPEPEGEAWTRAQEIADEVYYGRHTPVLNGALFFHATYVKPDRPPQRRRVARIGNHVFYR